MANRDKIANAKGLPGVWGVLLFLMVAVSAYASDLDSLYSWARRTFWGHYVPQESLWAMYQRSLAEDDMPTAVQLAAAVSFVKYGTVDSALFDIAYCFIREGDFSAAEQAIRRAKKIFGECAMVFYLDALAELYSGDPKKAAKILKKALRRTKDPDERRFLETALAVMEVLRGKVAQGFSRFREIEGLRRIGFGEPLYEARLLGVKSLYGAGAGTLWVRQYYGVPSMILRIRPVFRFVDGSVWVGNALTVEQVSSILGSPYFQVNVERSGAVVIPRWTGIPVSADLNLWFVYVDENDIFDSVLVRVSGKLTGFAPADSFSVAIEELRRDAIVQWFDSLANPRHNFGEPFWQFVLSERIAAALSDSSQWEYGLALADSVLEFAPYLEELYLWRGAFSLFLKDYEDAYRYFVKPLERDSCNVWALYDAGVAQFFMGDYPRADSFFARAMRCDTLFAPVYLARGVLAQDFFDQPDSAMYFYSKYLELSDFLVPQVEQWMDELMR